MNVQVKPARGAEVKLCRMLLGGAASTHPDYHLFLAVDDSHRPLGAGSVRSGVEEIGEWWTLHIHTVPAFRGSGVDSELLRYARSYAVAHGVKTLRTLCWFEQGSEEERYWMSLGFVPGQVRYVHELAVDRAFAKMSPLFQEVCEHGWIPPDAKVIPLAEVDLQRVCELHLQYLGGGSIRHLLPLLDGTASNPYDPQISMVLVRGDQTMGFTLSRFPEPTVCEIGANVLHPSVRLGWANVMLKHDALLRVMARKATVLRYFTMEKHTDTRRTSKWIGGATTRTEVCLEDRCQAASGATE